MPATNQQFGPYAVERELGRGAFGVVYRAAPAADPDAPPVALKVLRAAGQLDRLRLESSLLARLDHPNIVRVKDAFPHADGTQFVIVLEYVGGGDLKTAIDEADRFPAEVVRDLLGQVGGALAEAHKKGITHRDLKPANVLLDRTGDGPRYVLTDFGVSGADEGLRSQKKLAGTLLFMAPEQLRGRPGPQSDLWALGVTAYRMLTGEYPFPGPSSDELYRQIQLASPPSPDSGDPDLDRAVLRLLDRNETERIGSADDLLRELGVGKRTKRSGSGTHRVTPAAARKGSLDEVLRRGAKRQYIWAGVWLALYFLTHGHPLAIVCTAAGLAAFYDAHRRRVGWKKGAQVVGAFAVLSLPTWSEVLLGLAYDQPVRVTNLVTGGGSETVSGLILWLARVSPIDPRIVLLLVGLVMMALTLLLPVLACNSYARGNRLRRERLLLSASAAATPEQYLALLRHELDYRFEDVGFHLKYAEALAARGDHRAAAVEARLLLDQDPYHFAGNLLLADSYRRLGLHADAARVCDEYLAVAGYCFEFAELRDQCRRAGGAVSWIVHP